MRAFDAGWGGVVTKTIGLHPVVNVRGPEDEVPARHADSPHLSMKKRPGDGAALVVELGAHLRQDARLVGAAHRAASRRRIPTRMLVASIMAGSGSDSELRALADAGEGVPGRRRRRARAEPVVPAHGSQGHGLEHRQGSGADLDRHRRSVKEVARVPVWAKLTPSTTDIVVEARGAFLGGADAIVVVEHVPVAAAHRSRDARVRDERRRPASRAAASAVRRSCRCRWRRWRS